MTKAESIAKVLKEEIRSEILLPGQALASENQLTERFHTSRTTVRRALEILVREGFIRSVPGSCYLVNEPELNTLSLHFDPCFGAEEVRLIDLIVIPAGEEARAILHLKKGQLVILIRRAFYRNGKVIALDEKILPYQRGMPLMEVELKRASLSEILAKKNSIFAMTRRIRIRASLASDFLSKNMHIPLKSPLLLIEERVYQAEGETAGFGKSYLIPESFLEAEVSF